MSAVEVAAISAAAVGAAICVVGLATQVSRMLSLPYKMEVAPPKGSAGGGVVYAFSTGMAPWTKESTRRHWPGYVRGIIFHTGVFVALATLFVGPWTDNLPAILRTAAAVVMLTGGLAGLGGLIARLTEHNLRRLSTRDDYFSVALVSLFVLSATLMMAASEAKPIFYSLAAVTLAVLPFSKVRHCVYFFFSRVMFGSFFGHRGVIEEARLR